MNWFTSDLHFGDTRDFLYGRDIYFKDNKEFQHKVIFNWNKQVDPHDTVYVLGDVAFTSEACLAVRDLPGRKILIRGNYDRDDMTAHPGVTQYLPEVFEEIHDELIIEMGGIKFNLNHFPEKCLAYEFNLTGHIHGLWRVQRNMINVGIDAWNHHLLDEPHIIHFYNAIQEFFDINVFAGELPCNNPDYLRDK